MIKIIKILSLSSIIMLFSTCKVLQTTADTAGKSAILSLSEVLAEKSAQGIFYKSFPNAWKGRLTNVLEVLSYADFVVYNTDKEYRGVSPWNRAIYRNWIYLKSGNVKAVVGFNTGDADKMNLWVSFTEGCGCIVAQEELRLLYGCNSECKAHSQTIYFLLLFQEQ